MQTDTISKPKVARKSIKTSPARAVEKRNPIPIFGQRDIDAMQAMLDKGKTPEEVAEAMGINYNSMRYALSKCGLRLDVELIYRRRLVKAEPATAPA